VRESGGGLNSSSGAPLKTTRIRSGGRNRFRTMNSLVDAETAMPRSVRRAKRRSIGR
jgi:hypothetical protein